MNACAAFYRQSPAVSIQLDKRDGSELFGIYSLACTAGLDERASRASPKRKRGNPDRGPNKTAAILKSTNETCTSLCRTVVAAHPFHRRIGTHVIVVIAREDVMQ